jgi:superfamily II DNA or RNA helicase
LSSGLAEPQPRPAASFLESARLVTGGPHAFRRAIERLLLYLGFEDVRDIDGPGDEGGDILGRWRGLRWVFQCKWTIGETISEDAVREVDSAKSFYRADRAVVATNARPGRGAINRRNSLLSVGVRVDFWDGAALRKFAADVVPEHAPARIVPRDYQREAITAATDALAQGGRAFVILATGLGKTVVAGEIICDYLADTSDGSVLVVAHLKELVQQLERATWRHLPSSVPTAILTGDEKPSSFTGVVCATVESALTAVKAGWRPLLVVVDEAHHVGEGSMFERLLAELPDVPRLGMTATPWRGDKYDVAHVFGPAVFKMGIAEGMAAGYLSEVDYRLFLDQIDWGVVRETSDYGLTLGDLNQRLFLPQRDEAVIDAIRGAWSKTRGPRAVVFCRTIAHAEEFAQLLREAGWRRSECLHSGHSRRERNILMSEFRDGRVPIITAVDILNEGVDVPDVNIICFLRVTHSRRIFVQQLGRGLRLRPGKVGVTVLDFVSDLRRIKATLDLKRALSEVPEEEIERLHLRGTSIEFTNPQIGTFLEEWLKDAASLEDADEEVRLQFPPIAPPD